jgi:hypothetical protein
MGYGPRLVYRKRGLGDGFSSFLYGEFLEEWKKEILYQEEIIMEENVWSWKTCVFFFFLFLSSFALLLV